MVDSVYLYIYLGLAKLSLYQVVLVSIDSWHLKGAFHEHELGFKQVMHRPSDDIFQLVQVLRIKCILLLP